MSVVTVQLGQCGNQVGFDWFTNLSKETNLSNVPGHIQKNFYSRDVFERWFYPSCNEQQIFARAVLVDTEQKVINHVFKKASATQIWKYNDDNIVYRKDGGSGNNWALGNCIRGPEMQDEVLNCVRKEVENCDRLCSLHNVLSCAGGTGSGLGSCIIAHLRDEYPSKYIINSLIFPYEGGEIITQNYNLILNLSKLYDISDVHVVFQNDDLHKIYSSLCVNKPVELNDLNSLISIKLSSFLQPIQKCSQNYFPAILSDIVPHPCYKLTTVKCAPYISSSSLTNNASLTWNALLKYLVRSLRVPTPKGDVLDFKMKDSRYGSQNLLPKYPSCLTNVLITRGCDNIVSDDMKDFHNSELYPKWVSVNSGFNHFHQKEQMLEFSKFASLITNNSSMYECLNNVIEKAWTQFSQKAYLHQYTKYGLEEDSMGAAFMKVEGVAKYYKDLTIR